MSSSSKLKLSAEELQLVTNTDWILTKQKIMEAAVQMMGELAETVKPNVKFYENSLPAEVISSSPKIAKGENYKLLPYVMLDYPRCFTKENVFAIRTMFWWGNFFSVTLHISGSYKTQFENRILNKLNVLQQYNFFIGINEDEWQHDFTADNYTAATSLNTAAIAALFNAKPFIKIAVKHNLQQWNTMPALLEQSFLEMLKIITT